MGKLGFEAKRKCDGLFLAGIKKTVFCYEKAMCCMSMSIKQDEMLFPCFQLIFSLQAYIEEAQRE